MKPKILGHGGHGRPTPPQDTSRRVTTRAQGKGTAAPTRKPGAEARQPMGGRVSNLAVNTALNPTHIGNAIMRAQKGESAIAPWVLKVTGFSTPTMRRLVNNLMDVKKKLVYLEAGAYCGGTACAAVSNRENVTGYVYEDFSQPFDLPDVEAQLLANLAKTENLTLIEGDFFKSELPEATVDVFFYDGEHSEEAQSRALPRIVDHLSDVSLMLVDDFNWGSVSKGTKAGFAAVKDKVEVAARWILEGEKKADDEIWHNGLAIFLLVRK